MRVDCCKCCWKDSRSFCGMTGRLAVEAILESALMGYRSAVGEWKAEYECFGHLLSPAWLLPQLIASWQTLLPGFHSAVRGAMCFHSHATLSS
jgi:hypothetical protein